MLFLSLISLWFLLTRAMPSQRAANVGFFDPTTGGGSWLDVAGTGVGEPMNVGFGL